MSGESAPNNSTVEAAPSRVVTVRTLGRLAYADALTLQRDLHQQRKAGAIPDTVLLVEHDPVLTLGRAASTAHILVPEARLATLGIPVVRVERGGEVTYHGPGQLVVYPILDLTTYGRDIHRYVRMLEETAIRLLGAYGVQGDRRPGTPGVWAGPAKIASVGVFVSRWVTMHGLAINIDPDLSHFDLINACGLTGMPVTSLSRETSHPLTLDQILPTYLDAFRTVFNVLLTP